MIITLCINVINESVYNDHNFVIINESVYNDHTFVIINESVYNDHILCGY